ncbi:DUF6118 family protein [Sphingomonas oryzagri]
MDNDASPNNGPGQAFEALRAEVSLLRRGVEGLTAERHSAPDYGPTLEQMNAYLKEITGWARKVNGQPAMQLTPELLAREIARVAADARKRDREIIEHADRRMGTTISRIERIVESASQASEQARAISIACGTALLAGMLMILTLQALAAILQV